MKNINFKAVKKCSFNPLSANPTKWSHPNNSSAKTTYSVRLALKGLTVLYHISHMNIFLANVPILYPLETPENLRFSGVGMKEKYKSSYL